MADYIDRESLVKDFVGYCNHLSQVCHSNDDVYAEMFGIVQCLNRVESAPKADVVEVVRCKDCKYCESEVLRYKKTGEFVCVHDNWQDAEGWSRYIELDGFCSCGERKGEGE